MAPTLVCGIFGFSGAALVKQAGDLVSYLWVLLQHQYKKQHITTLVIWTLNWSMGMFGASASFFKFSTSGWVTLDRSKCVQTLKLDVVNVGIWRFADFNAT